MVEVLFAQVLSDTLIAMYASNNSLTILIILAGFIVSMVISMVVSLIFSEISAMSFSFYAAALSFVANIALWILISYATMIAYHQEELGDLNYTQLFANIPKVLAYYSVYHLSNVTLLWLISLGTYSVIFAIILKLLGAKKAGKYSKYSKKQMW